VWYDLDLADVTYWDVMQIEIRAEPGVDGVGFTDIVLDGYPLPQMSASDGTNYWTVTDYIHD
jgi:hypothetical protein